MTVFHATVEINLPYVVIAQVACFRFHSRVPTVGYSTFELTVLFFFFFAAFHRNAPVVSAEKQHASATLHICVQFTDGVFFCLLVKVSITGPSFSLVFTVAALCLCDPAKQLLQASAPPTRPC